MRWLLKAGGGGGSEPSAAGACGGERAGEVRGVSWCGAHWAKFLPRRRENLASRGPVVPEGVPLRCPLPLAGGWTRELPEASWEGGSKSSRWW